MRRLPVEIARGIWTLEVPLGDYDVRGVLILGRERALVWDTLSHPRDMASWLPLIGDRALVVVYSHGDWDHVWGTRGLPVEGVPIIAHEVCRDRFYGDIPSTWAEMRAAEPGRWDEVVLVPPTETLLDCMLLDLGGTTVSLHHLPGHTPDCIVGLVREEGILLAGDTLETPFPVIPQDGPLGDWIAGLEVWAQDVAVRQVIPAHGPAGGRELIDRNLGYLKSIYKGIPVEPDELPNSFYVETHRQNLHWGRPTRPTTGENAIQGV